MDNIDDFSNKISEDFGETTEVARAKHIWNSTRFRFQPYDWWKDDLDFVDGYHGSFPH